MNRFKAWRATLNPRRSFRTRLGMALAGSIILLSLLLAWTIGSLSKVQVEREHGNFVEQLAYQMANSLDREMFSYFQQVRNLATLDTIRESAGEQNIEKKRALLENLQHTYRNYAWIGITNSEGLVMSSTNKLLEGQVVAQRPWFTNGKHSPVVLDLHEAKLLSKLVPNPSPTGEPLRFIDVAAPVFDMNKQFRGVLGAHLYWQWAQELRDSLLYPIESSRQVKIMILSKAGELLLAHTPNRGQQPLATPAHFSSLASFQLAQQGKTSFLLETGEDGNTYMTGYAKTQGYNNYPDLGWIILVRQSADIAFASARSLQQQVMLWGGLMGITSAAIAWSIAGRIVEPVVKIATSSERIRKGDLTVRIPIFAGVDEVAQLSRSLFKLFASLEKQNQLLADFNEQLEQRVQGRTQELHLLNQKLADEIEERKQIEVELQLVNQELQRLSMVDGLTGVANRRCFDEYLQKEWQRLAHEQLPISLILLDVDYFKLYNDYYGHQAGDRCLQHIACALHHSVHRTTDLIARYGGEEFAVILPNTQSQGVAYIAKNMHQVIAKLQITHPTSKVSQYVTISMGGATLVPTINTQPTRLLETADRNLYRAKERGRNCFISNETESNQQIDKWQVG